MTTDLKHILIFKTNIETERQKQRVQATLDTHEHILQWNIDQHDIDCVLRIVSNTLTTEQIICLIKHHGFECTELE